MLLKTIAGVSLFLSALIFALCRPAMWLLPVLSAGIWLLLVIIAFAFLLILCLLVDMETPREHDSKFYRAAMHLYIEALISLFRVRVHTQGLEKAPKDGRFLLVCNHQHEADPAILLHYFKQNQLAFISKQEARRMFVVGPMMHMTMCQMVNRENDREALKTILKCIQLIREDEVSVGVFPEGGIKDLGKLAHFRSGVFKIAQKANVPIVVCTMTNTANIVHNGFRLKPTDVTLHLLDVIPAEALKGRTTVDIADQIHAIMLSDLGESWRPEENS